MTIRFALVFAFLFTTAGCAVEGPGGPWFVGPSGAVADVAALPMPPANHPPTPGVNIVAYPPLRHSPSGVMTTP